MLSTVGAFSLMIIKLLEEEQEEGEDEEERNLPLKKIWLFELICSRKGKNQNLILIHSKI